MMEQPIEFSRAEIDPLAAGEAMRSGKKTPPDVISLLMQDHREVEFLFRALKAAPSDVERGRLAEKICLSLKAHMEAEEKHLYPLTRKLTADDNVVGRSVIEHGEAKRLIEEVEATGGLDPNLVEALEQSVIRHVLEEETELFPKLRAEAKFDAYASGRTLANLRLAAFAKLTGKPLPLEI
jgi:hemerythrin superfamily protein